MPNKNTLMNIFCYGLPGVITRPICREYDTRWEEIRRIWSNPKYERYMFLKSYTETIENLLALCLFYRYVMGNITGGNNLFIRLNHNSEEERSIAIGSFLLDKKESNRILALSIELGKMRRRYQLDDYFFEFTKTIDFLRNCRNQGDRFLISVRIKNLSH